MGKKTWNTRKGKPQRNWMRATLWRTRLHFSTAENALSDSGSVALTPISAYTSTLRCSYEGIGQCVCERTRQSPRKKHAAERGCNPLTLTWASNLNTYLLHSHSYSPLAVMLGRISDIFFFFFCMATMPPLCRSNDFTINKPAWRKTPGLFPQRNKRGHESFLMLFHGFTLFSQAFAFPSFQETFVSSRASISLQSGQPLFEMQRSSATAFTVYSDSQLAAIACCRAPTSESVVMWYLIT